MKRDNINYFAVGLFVLLTLGLLFYALMRIGGDNEKGDIYYTDFKNVAGIKPGAVVAFEGFELGNIEAIQPTQKDGSTLYRLALKLKQGWKIPSDSRAVITTTGLLSGSVVEIRGGASKTVINPGGVIPAITSASMFDAIASLTEQLSDIAKTEAKPLMANLNRRVDKIGASLELGVPESMGQLQTVLKKLNNTASLLESTLNQENRRHLASTLKNVDQSSANVLRLSSDFAQTQKQIDALLADTHGLVSISRPDLEASVVELRASMRKINTILHHLEGASLNSKEITRQVRQNPSLIIQSRPAIDQSEDEK